MTSQIKDLTLKTAPVTTDEIEIQETGGGTSKRATLGSVGGTSAIGILARCTLITCSSFNLATGASVDLTWPYEDYDPSGLHAANSAYIVAPAGANFCEFSMAMDFQVSTGTMDVRMLINDSTGLVLLYMEETVAAVSQSFVRGAASPRFACVPGDTFKLTARNANAAALIGGGAALWIFFEGRFYS